MRLDCVISIIIITININNKVFLSVLFLLPRLSLPNIYKYRTVPRRRRNSKGRADKGRRKRKERPEESERARTEGGKKQGR